MPGAYLLLTDDAAVPGLFAPESGRLGLEGDRFVTDAGELWQKRDYSWFLGFLRYCRGEDVRPDLRWLRAMGFNMVRIFGPLPWVETPDYRIEDFRFDLLAPFLALLEEHGIRCNWSLAHYPDPGWQAFGNQWYEIADGFWTPIAEFVNEPQAHAKPDPIIAFAGVNTRRILTAYGYYAQFYDDDPLSWPPIFNFGNVHTPRDRSWARRARNVQELMYATHRAWVGDEPAKIMEPWEDQPGGKNDPHETIAGQPNPNWTPANICWYLGVCYLWTPGGTFHSEIGKWGHVPAPGTLQHTCAEAVRDHVFLKMDATWQTGEYNRAGNSDSPVDGPVKYHGDDVWTYTSLHAAANKAISVRVGPVPLQARNGWRIVDQWGPWGSFARLER